MTRCRLVLLTITPWVVCLGLACDRGGGSAEDDRVYCLAEACRLSGLDVDRAGFARAVGPPARPAIADGGGPPGTALETLGRAAQQQGGRTRVVAAGVEGLRRLKGPAVVVLKGGRFATVAAFDPSDSRIFLLEGKGRSCWTRLEDLGREWDGALLTFEPRPHAGGPRVWCPSEAYDLGSFSGVPGEKRDLTFVNTGDRPLTITPAGVSCGCAKWASKPGELPPGGFARLLLDIDTSQKPMGQFGLSVFLETNDPRTPELDLSLTGSVRPGVVLHPSYFSFGDILPTEGEKELVAEARYEEGESSEIVPSRLDPGMIFVADRRRLDGVHEVRLKLDPSKVEVGVDGRFRAAAVLRTTDPRPKTLVAGAVGRRLSWIDVMPRTVFLGPVAGDSWVERSVYLRGFADGAVRAEPANPGMVEARVGDRSLVLRLRTPVAPGVFRTSITLKQDRHAVVLPIVGLVPGEGGRR